MKSFIIYIRKIEYLVHAISMRKVVIPTTYHGKIIGSNVFLHVMQKSKCIGSSSKKKKIPPPTPPKKYFIRPSHSTGNYVLFLFMFNKIILINRIHTESVTNCEIFNTIP